jgi:hypothetical protein
MVTSSSLKWQSMPDVDELDRFLESVYHSLRGPPGPSTQFSDEDFLRVHIMQAPLSMLRQRGEEYMTYSFRMQYSN